MNISLPKRKVAFQPSIFRGKLAVSFRECNCIQNIWGWFLAELLVRACPSSRDGQTCQPYLVGICHLPFIQTISTSINLLGTCLLGEFFFRVPKTCKVQLTAGGENFDEFSDESGMTGKTTVFSNSVFATVFWVQQLIR